MTLSISTRYKKYEPTVSTDTFLVTFPIFSTDDLRIVVDGAETELYSITATFVDGRSDDASVILNSAVTDVDVEIYGARSPRRETSYINNSPNLAELFQRDADAITAVQQEQATNFLRAILLPASEATGYQVDLTAAQRAMKFLGFDGNGDLTASLAGPSGLTLLAFMEAFLESVDVAAARTALGLGAVATESVNTVAKGGTGGTTPAAGRAGLEISSRVIPGDDADAINESGFYDTDSSTTTLPAGIGQFGGLIHVEREQTTDRAWQQYAPAGAPEQRLFFRNRSSSGWSSWAEVLQSNSAGWRAPFGVDAGDSVAGIYLANDGFIASARESNTCLQLNRKGSTGTIVSIENDEVVVGTISIGASTTAYNTSSDRNLKENLRDFDAGAILDATEVWEFDWKRGGGNDFGVIAQDAHKVLPQAITEGTEPGADKFTPWQADYSKYVPILLREAKEMRKRMAAMEEMIMERKSNG